MSSPTEEALATRRRAKSAAEAQAPDVLFFPETWRREWLVTLAVFVVSCAYLRLFRDVMVTDPDEGVALQGAERILRGQVLYRDFFSFMTPGSFYWMALLFKVFGSSVRVARTLLIIYGGLFSSFTYLIARRASPRWASLALSYMLLVSMLPFRFQALHNWDSTLWALLAFYSAVLLLQTKRVMWAFAGGTFTAWTFLFEQSKGGGLALGLLIAFAWLAYAKPESGFRQPRLWLVAVGGSLWPFFVAIGYWAHAGALGEMWSDVLWPLLHYTGANDMYYGAIFHSYQAWVEVFQNASWVTRAIEVLVLSPCLVVALLPILALVALAICISDLISNRLPWKIVSYDLLVSAVACGAALSLFVKKRPDVAQMIFVEPLLILVLVWILERRRPIRWLPGAGTPELVGVLLLLFTAFGAMFLRGSLQQPLTVKTRRGNLRAEYRNDALAYLMANTYPGETILVYPYAANLYFLTDTYSPTQFDYLQPGMHTRDQFEESVRAVQQNRTGLIMYDLGFFTNQVPQSWPFTPPASLAEEPLRILLISAYRPCAVVGGDRDRFVAFWRKDLPCPPNATP